MQKDFLQPLQAAALKHHPAAADFHRGKAPRTVALGGLEAFRAVTQTGQLSICERHNMSSPYTHAVYGRKPKTCVFAAFWLLLASCPSG